MRCKAMTNYTDRGSPAQCLRPATHGEYCWQHRGHAHNAPGHMGNLSGSGKLYLINTEEDRVVAGPAANRNYLLDIASDEVAGGARVECLQIMAPVYTIAVESVNLKLTEA